MSYTGRRDQAIRSRALVETVVQLLHHAQLEAIGAVGHVDDNTRAIADVMQQAEQLLPRLDHLIRVVSP